MQSAHLHLGEDGDCGQCLLGLDSVSAPHGNLIECAAAALLTSVIPASFISPSSFLPASRPINGARPRSSPLQRDAISSYNITKVLRRIWSSNLLLIGPPQQAAQRLRPAKRRTHSRTKRNTRSRMTTRILWMVWSIVL